jgi:CheY-like chemotaxis protein
VWNAGGVAHDFNNLLTAINGYSDLSLKRIPEDDSLRLNIGEIRKAGERAANLTRQLLAFSRKQFLQPKVVDLNELITDTVKMLTRLIGEDIEIRLELNGGLWKVQADPGQMDQMLINLAVNARDAMPQGGRLTVKTENVLLGEAVAGRYESVQSAPHVLVEVSDTGCGMDEETRRRAFEPFYTTKEVGKGTGLGLSTVYGIVKQSGGYIEIESEMGKGASFRVYLPRLVEEHEAAEGQKTIDAPLGGTEQVFLVEDEEMVRTLTQSVLEDAGYRVLTAVDGRDALRVCQSYTGQIHLLLTDVVMPRMGGRQLVEEVSKIRPDLRVLYMSGYTDDAIVHHGVLDPGTHFLEKPFSPDALLRKIREALDAER